MNFKPLTMALALCAVACTQSNAQNIAINTTGSLPDTSAVLDISSSTKGLLLPRLSNAEQNAIPLPATGLLIFNTTLNTFAVNTGTSGSPIWVSLSLATSAGWGLTGNSGISAANYIGTTNNASLRFRANNIERMVIDSNGRVGIGTNAPAADLTFFQSSGTGVTKGIRFAGNSIGGTSSGTGFGLSLGYNVTNNKQLWLGDADYLGNSAGTFFRFASGNGYTMIDAVAGDNSTRRTVALGVGGDLNSCVILGSDFNNTAPSSYIWGNGNMAIGSSYKANAAPSNGLLVQGNVGIGNTAPGSALDVKGTLRLSGSTSGYVGFAPAAVAGSTTYILPAADGINGQSLVTNGSSTLSWAASTASNWSLTGNSGTNAATNFIGTTDNIALRFKTNGTARMHLDVSGGLFIGDSVSNYSNTVSNTQAGLRSDWTTSLLAADTPRIALQGQMRVNLTASSISNSVRGFNGSAIVGVNNGVTSGADIYGGYFLARRQTSSTITEGSGTLAALAGAGVEYGHNTTANAGGTTTNVYGVKLNPIYAAGTITNLYGLYFSAPTTGGAVTNMYDIYLASHSLTGVTNSWGIYQANTKNNYFAGNTGIGTALPGSALDVKGTLRLSGSTSGYVGFAPAAVAGSTTYTLPAADGSSGQSLVTNGSGTLSWAASTASNWSLTGNSSITAANFLGSTNNASVRFKSNNTQVVSLDSTGNVAIGKSPVQITGTNAEKFLVDAGSTAGNPTTSYNLISGKGYIDNYLQLNIQNKSAGIAASTDIVATADNGDETTNYIDMGINSSAYTGGFFGAANEGYLYNIGQNLLIGTGTTGKSLVFMTGGSTQSTNERMRIDGSGNTGIGTNSPGSKLDVKGTIRLSGSTSGYVGFAPAAVAGSTTYTLPSADGTSGQILSTNGSGTLSWAAVSGTAWARTGNSGTTAGTDFIGTTDNQGLVFKVNSSNAGFIDAGYTNQNNYFGLGAGNYGTSTGQYNIAMGTSSLSSNTTGQINVALGSSALQYNTQGSGNNAVGQSALAANTIGNGNTAVGQAALNKNVSGSSNTGIGGSALRDNLASNNIAIGQNAMSGNTSGTNNVGIGNSANAAGLTTSSTTAIGFAVLQSNTGNSNTAIGFSALFGNTSGAANTAIGTNSLYTNTTGSNNTTIGYNADVSSNNLSNATAIGYEAKVAASNSLVLGGTGSFAVNVGIGNTSPNSTLSVSGSVAMAYRTVSGAATIGTADNVMINTGAAATWTMPSVGGCAGRIYKLVNQGTGNITLSTGYKPDNAGALVTTLGFASGSNMIEIISDGTNWRRIL